ncbi:MAG TPA: heparan-alpha-glucosaminide N-acetyltransferase domain-containing protein [Myxococcaceae bacterium]|nr:heparan-alpha-glucosaminide N-acetyltransferase domain-containing protein [Myxococcaceae bacterium]
MARDGTVEQAQPRVAAAHGGAVEQARPSVAVAPGGAAEQERRFIAIDWVRGLVMVLMTLDHASAAFNAGRLFTDSVAMDRSPLPAPDFFTRWVTHICAPTFVFLAGTSIALSAARRTRAGDAPGAIDRHLVIRGLIITALELWMSLVFGPHAPGWIVLQVLYALGMGMVCMAALRHVPVRWLLGLALVGWVVSEPLADWARGLSGPIGSVGLLLFNFGMVVPKLVVVGYPLFPWLCTMVLGYCFGHFLLGLPAEGRSARAARLLLGWGVGLLALFLVLRALNGLGNMGLLRHDDSLVQWLHVSKYPPSLTFWGLELGLAALLLALAFRAGLKWPPLVLLGQTALFFYLLHAHLLDLSARMLGMHMKAGLLATYVSWALVILVLLPLCSWYRGYKRRHPHGWPQYI